jgi:hypothetical protein
MGFCIAILALIEARQRSQRNRAQPQCEENEHQQQQHFG